MILKTIVGHVDGFGESSGNGWHSKPMSTGLYRIRLSENSPSAENAVVVTADTSAYERDFTAAASVRDIDTDGFVVSIQNLNGDNTDSSFSFIYDSLSVFN